jgi:hypothetical protein
LTENRNDFSKRLNNLLVWPTLVLLIVFAFAGYGTLNSNLTSKLTGGLFTTAFSLYLHKSLAAPVLILLTIHVIIGLKSALTRRGIGKGTFPNIVLVTLGLLAVAMILLLQLLTF